MKLCGPALSNLVELEKALEWPEWAADLVEGLEFINTELQRTIVLRKASNKTISHGLLDLAFHHEVRGLPLRNLVSVS